MVWLDVEIDEGGGDKDDFEKVIRKKVQYRVIQRVQEEVSLGVEIVMGDDEDNRKKGNIIFFILGFFMFFYGDLIIILIMKIIKGI